MEWEYNTVFFIHYEKGENINPVNTMLNEQGKEGWELVSTIHIGHFNESYKHLLYIFKRPRKLEPNRTSKNN